ncbi:MAG TPA: phytanoyl-CoA dioxygenase family protein [Thermoanaerobaculia bacterium]|jgi:hypothetical protein
MDITAVAEELLTMSRLGEAQAEEYVARAVDPRYWSSLWSSARLRPPLPSLSSSQVAYAAKNLEANGYFALDRVIPIDTITTVREQIDAVRAAGWPAVFAFLYDDAWQLYRSPAIQQIARAAVGDDAVQTGYFWAHFVPPIPEARGWTPHADANLIHDPKRLTIWIAITEATLDNGCIYVIPRHRLDAHALGQFFDLEANFDRATTLRLLQSSRALPAAAGSILGWEFTTVHWGSVVHRNVEIPRISISAELIRDADLAADEVRLPLDELPGFEARLRLIANAMKTYVHWDMQLARFEPVVRRLLERGAA